MKKVMKCTALVLCLLVLMICATAAETSPMAEIDNGVFSDEVSDTVLVGYTEFGWVTFTYTATYEETYTQTGATAELSYRKSTWDVTPSRTNAPAQVQTSPVVQHLNSAGSSVASFLMLDEGTSLTMWKGTKSNSEKVQYDVTAGYVGSTGFGIAGSTVIYPHSVSLNIDFDLIPL